MFAEIYDPYKVMDIEFGKVKAMNPIVRREVLAHLGYKKIDFSYVHPSWLNNGEAVEGLDLCFLPMSSKLEELETELIVTFLKGYYDILPNKPKAWLDMINELETKDSVKLLEI